MRVEKPSGEGQVRTLWLEVTETTRAVRDDGIVVGVHARTELFLDFDPVGLCCREGDTADRVSTEPRPTRAMDADVRSARP